jgi:hypothetical protein
MIFWENAIVAGATIAILPAAVFAVVVLRRMCQWRGATTFWRRM